MLNPRLKESRSKEASTPRLAHWVAAMVLVVCATGGRGEGRGGGRSAAAASLACWAAAVHSSAGWSAGQHYRGRAVGDSCGGSGGPVTVQIAPSMTGRRRQQQHGTTCACDSLQVRAAGGGGGGWRRRMRSTAAAGWRSAAGNADALSSRAGSCRDRTQRACAPARGCRAGGRWWRARRRLPGPPPLLLLVLLPLLLAAR